MLSCVKAGDIVYTSKFGPGQVVGIDRVNAYPVQVVRFPNYFHDTGAEFAWDGTRKGGGDQPGCWPIMHPNVPREKLPCLLQHAKVGDKVFWLGRGEYYIERFAKRKTLYPIKLRNEREEMCWVARDGKVWRSDISPSVFLTHSAFTPAAKDEPVSTHKKLLEDVKKGAWVFSIRNGWTQVYRIVQCEEPDPVYSIELRNPNKDGWSRERVTLEGNAVVDDAYPSCWPKGHPDIPHWAPPCPEDEKPNFRPFDRVLVRDENGEEWRADFFSTFEDSIDLDYPYRCISSLWAQCIPYEGNEHLVGTRGNVEGTRAS